MGTQLPYKGLLRSTHTHTVNSRINDGVTTRVAPVFQIQPGLDLEWQIRPGLGMTGFELYAYVA